MTQPTIGSLRVDGATPHYEVRGHGPLLLLIPGGTGGAASFDPVADGLAAEYTVAKAEATAAAAAGPTPLPRPARCDGVPAGGRVVSGPGTGATSWRTPCLRCR